MSEPQMEALAPLSYVPHRARIATVVIESADTRTFVLALEPRVAVFDEARPGQFVMISVLGYGEAAFTLSALPRAGGAAGTVVVTVRRIGTLTSALFALGPGACIGVRGPFGRGFQASDRAVPIVYVAGGCGLAPLRAAITSDLARPRSAPLAIVYGAAHPESRIFSADLSRWSETPGVRLIECVEHRDGTWQGRTGGVLDFLDEAATAVGARNALVCGSPAMLSRAAAALLRAGLDAANVQIALERYMKCGTGQCGHCYVNHRYVCTDGPVFSLTELLRLSDAFSAPVVVSGSAEP
jgi:NAD(P)H-flavin reductase